MPSTTHTHVDALARTYAQALFDAAQETTGREGVESVAGELDELLELARQNKALGEFLRSRIIPAAKRADSLRRIFQDAISELTLRFLLILNEKDRLAHLESIAQAYDQIVQERFGRVEVDVVTASLVDRAQLDAVAARLREALGKEPVLHHYVDESMLGGLKLQIGDQLIDASVATQLRRIRER
ncbi:MAG: ATP synthase F1 subunit delta, partial [Planctomycetota bacterium]